MFLKRSGGKNCPPVSPQLKERKSVSGTRKQRSQSHPRQKPKRLLISSAKLILKSARWPGKRRNGTHCPRSLRPKCNRKPPGSWIFRLRRPCVWPRDCMKERKSVRTDRSVSLLTCAPTPPGLRPRPFPRYGTILENHWGRNCCRPNPIFMARVTRRRMPMKRSGPPMFN